MSEEKTKKKREWVKNAAIIFLAVMLVLTFFSNTIMNRSLPEVAAQYVQPGSISATIRGSGTVEANESFTVKSEQTRMVLSVPVKEGDEVSVGDTLILFAEADSAELKNAQDTLDAALLTYKEALLDKGDGTYAKEQRAIEKAQLALDKAKAEQTANAVSDESIASAQSKVTAAQKDVDVQQATVTELQTKLDNIGGGTDYSAEISAKQRELNTAKGKLSAAEISYKTEYENFKKIALAYMNSTLAEGKKQTTASATYMSATSKLFSRWLDSLGAGEDIAPAKKPAWWPADLDGKFNKGDIEDMNSAYTEIQTLTDTISTLNAEISSLSAQDNSGSYSSANTKLTAAKTKLATLTAVLTTEKNALDTLNAKREAYDAATIEVYNGQDALEAALDTLAEAKISDQKDALRLENMKKDVSEATSELNKLKSGSTESAIKSEVNGVVKTITTSAGNTAEAGADLIIVEVPDLGYCVSLSVTKEQSKRVKIGDVGTLTSYGYYGQPATARLAAITTDPANPSANKRLVFDLEGEDIDSGSMVNIAIGEKSANYDIIVPNSAIRDDTNGKFVLAVITKSSPLSNRYIATRIDVQVLATDDVNSAVSGGLTPGDFVITNSTKPIEAGTQVRLADNT